MAVKATQLYDTNFFSQIGTEYICTGYMYGMFETVSIDDQLANQGVFMASQVMTGITGDPYESTIQQLVAAAAAQAASTGGASKPGMGGYKPGSKTGGSY